MKHDDDRGNAPLVKGGGSRGKGREAYVKGREQGCDDWRKPGMTMNMYAIGLASDAL